MMKDKRVSEHSSVNGNFSLISNHNKHLKQVRAQSSSTTLLGRTRKFIDGSGSGLETVVRCGPTEKIMVKTFRDGSYTLQRG